MPTASLTLLIRHLGHEGGRESKSLLGGKSWLGPCPVLGGDFVVFVFFFTKIKMKELIWKRCWGITVIDAYKLQDAAA